MPHNQKHGFEKTRWAYSYWEVTARKSQIQLLQGHVCVCSANQTK